MSAGDTLQGRRVPDSQWFYWRDEGLLKPGDYGRELITKDGNERWDWFVRCPDGQDAVLWVNEDDRNGNRHVITEHDDGTISVGGSILTRDGPRPVESESISGGPINTPGGWHGWLERGVWREV